MRALVICGVLLLSGTATAQDRASCFHNCVGEPPSAPSPMWQASIKNWIAILLLRLSCVPSFKLRLGKLCRRRLRR
jgi:hypothetical protein